MNPHFFKIILHDTIQNEKLNIPKRFVRKYGSELSGSVVLKMPNGTNWQVELTKNDGEVWLRKGFKEFGMNYSLEFGHLLVFEYENKSCFNVMIFDKSGAEIEYPGSTVDDAEMLEETQNVDTPLGLNDCNSCGAGKDQSQLPCDLPDKTNGGKKRARRVTAGFVSDNPSFEVTMRARHLKMSELQLSFAFAEKYLKGNKGKATLQVEGGQTWDMSLSISFHIKRAYFRTNWREFVRRNNLKEGDTIKFKLIDNKELVFDVTISRKTDRVRTLRSSSNKHLRVNCETKKNKRLKENVRYKLPPLSSPRNVEAADKVASGHRSRSFVLALASSRVLEQNVRYKLPPLSSPRNVEAAGKFASGHRSRSFVLALASSRVLEQKKAKFALGHGSRSFVLALASSRVLEQKKARIL